MIDEEYEHAGDTSLLVKDAYLSVKDDIMPRVKQSSHAKRLNRLDVHKDIEFCFELDKYEIVPVLIGKELVVKSS